MKDLPATSSVTKSQKENRQQTHIWLASDHAGFQLKSLLIEHLKAQDDFVVYDEGPLNNGRVDYPDYAWPLTLKVAESLKHKTQCFGILICGTGIGVSLVANQHPDIRAALAHNIFTAQMARLHNNAQVLCLGARVIGQDLALAMVDVFLNTKFEGGRHDTRLKLMNQYREQYEKS